MPVISFLNVICFLRIPDITEGYIIKIVSFNEIFSFPVKVFIILSITTQLNLVLWLYRKQI